MPPALRDGLSLRAAEPLAGAEPNEVKRVLDLLADERKTRDRVTEALKLIRLPDDLAELVYNGELTLAEADAVLTERHAADLAALGQWSQAFDGPTQALPYSKTWTPPERIPDNYPSVAAFRGRARDLAAQTDEWQ